MEAYTGFAQVYDTFMDNVPYDEWGEYLVSLLKKYGVEDGLVLDMGCGTGAMTRYLDAHGYDMTGIDVSEEMLTIAKEKSSPDILYLLQDMQEFELYGTVRAVVSICDSMNYILEPENAAECFNYIGYYSTNKAADEMVNPNLVVPEDVTKGEIVQNVSQEAEEAYSKAWTEFKAACD